MLRAARAMREHQAVLLLADDPVAKVDVPALAQANGWAISVRDGPEHAEYQLSRGNDREDRR